MMAGVRINFRIVVVWLFRSARSCVRNFGIAARRARLSSPLPSEPYVDNSGIYPNSGHHFSRAGKLRPEFGNPRTQVQEMFPRCSKILRNSGKHPLSPPNPYSFNLGSATLTIWAGTGHGRGLLSITLLFQNAIARSKVFVFG